MESVLFEKFPERKKEIQQIQKKKLEEKKQIIKEKSNVHLKEKKSLHQRYVTIGFGSLWNINWKREKESSKSSA